MSILKNWLQREREEAEHTPDRPAALRGDYPLRRLARPEDEIDLEEIWLRYRRSMKNGRNEGFVPILIHMNDTLEETLEMNLPEGESHLPLTDGLDGKACLDKLFQQRMEEFPEAKEVLYEPPKAAAKGTNRLLSLRQALKPDASLYLAKLPVKNPWEVPAWLPFGGWNACPDASEMMAVLKYWYEKYGAVPACIGSDTLELYVPEPVGEADALTLAQEQYAFCNDIVEQGMESITALAEELKKSTVWFFWWD